MTRRSAFPPALAAMLVCGCYELPPGAVPDAGPSTLITPGTTFPGLDPGAKDQTGLHFQVHAYGSDRVGQILDMAEGQYNQIMNDTGLYSFMPASGLYSIVVYGTRDEYLKKTGQPEWSGGLTYGNSIYSFEAPLLPTVLAHEMSHLLFHEYMIQPHPELRWLNEGLAVYEENLKARSMGLVLSGGWDIAQALRTQPIPFDQMTTLVPATEKERTVNLWYQQVGSVVGFMIERGGHNGFSQCMAALKDGKSVDAAVSAGFPNVWHNLGDLEAAWKRSL